MGTDQAIRVVEACYGLDAQPQQWLERVTRVFQPLLDAGLGAQGVVVQRRGYGQVEVVASMHLGPPETEEFTRRLFAHHTLETKELYFRRTPIVEIARETFEQFSGDAVDVYLQSSPPGLQIVDHVTLLSRDGSDYGVGICAFSERPLSISRAERRRFRKLVCHLTAGWRLFKHTYERYGEAVLTPDGRCLHAEGPARHKDARSVLRQAVRDVDRARGPLSRRDPDEALLLWKGLVKGRWSLVDRFESDGRRYVVAHRNDPEFDDPRKLSTREQQCARLAAVGHTNAEIAYALGLKESTAGSHVYSAMKKLGLEHRVQLADVLEPAALADTRVADLGPDPGILRALSLPSATPPPADLGLSPSEREVVRALVAGRSNREIARDRGSAERTVANQVQSIFRKLGVGSRAQLAAKLRAQGDPEG